jgi:hypothetical protein
MYLVIEENLLEQPAQVEQRGAEALPYLFREKL